MQKDLILLENSWCLFNDNDPKPLTKKLMKDAKLVSQKKKKGQTIFTFEFDDTLETDFVKSLTKILKTKKVKKEKVEQTEQVQQTSRIKIRTSKVHAGENQFNPDEYTDIGAEERKQDKQFWKKHRPAPRTRPIARTVEVVCTKCQKKEKVSASLMNLRNVEGGMVYVCNRCCAG